MERRRRGGEEKNKEGRGKEGNERKVGRKRGRRKRREVTMEGGMKRKRNGRGRSRRREAGCERMGGEAVEMKGREGGEDEKGRDGGREVGMVDMPRLRMVCRCQSGLSYGPRSHRGPVWRVWVAVELTTLLAL